MVTNRGEDPGHNVPQQYARTEHTDTDHQHQQRAQPAATEHTASAPDTGHERRSQRCVSDQVHQIIAVDALQQVQW